MRHILTALLFSLVITGSAFSLDFTRIRQAQQLIDSAKTQQELNAASAMLLTAWQSQLQHKETQVVHTLPKSFVKLFKRSMNLWKKHVEEMCVIRSEMFKQDMLQPEYYKSRGIASPSDGARRAKLMKPYVYNMSKAIYYQEKWDELDILLNAK